MMQSQARILKLSLVVLSLITLFNNCGSSKSGSATQASRQVPTNPSSPGGAESGWLSNCNQIVTNSVGVAGPVSTYFDPNTNQFLEDLIRLKFNEFPVELITTSNHYIQIFRWQENTPGKPVYNTTPVDIYFILKNTGQQVQANPVQVLSKNSIQKVIQDNNLNITADRFFASVIMVLDGMDLAWDAMTVALYDAPNSAPIDSVDVLLPAFDANPNTYAADHLATSLRTLHPMWAYKDRGYSDEDFYQFTNELCKGF